jgi:hypothetical protein
MNYNEKSLINHHFSNLLAECTQWKSPHTIIATLNLADKRSCLSLYPIAASLAKGFPTSHITLDCLIIHLIEVYFGTVKDVFFRVYLQHLLPLTSIHSLNKSDPYRCQYLMTADVREAAQHLKAMFLVFGFFEDNFVFN